MRDRSEWLLEYDWTSAVAYCSALNLDGASWRVPTVGELLTLVEFSAGPTVMIDSSFFPGTPSDVFSLFVECGGSVIARS